MALDADELNVELRAICKGAGVWDRRLANRVGPQIRAWCGISTEDGLVAVRQKLMSRVTLAVSHLPVQVRLAVLVGLGIQHDAQFRMARQRVQWLARRLDRHERTIRRHLYEGIAGISELAAGRRSDVAGMHGATRSPDAWIVQRCRALMRLDGPTPELTEERTIVALRDGLHHITLPFSLPRHAEDTSTHRNVETEMLHGGRILDVSRRAEAVFEYSVELPRPLNTGESHQYAIRFRLPEGQLMAPHYVFHPLRQCDSFELTIRFDPGRLPSRVQRLDGVLPQMLDSWFDECELLSIDALGEVHAEFANLHSGYAYGASWLA